MSRRSLWLTRPTCPGGGFPVVPYRLVALCACTTACGVREPRAVTGPRGPRTGAMISHSEPEAQLPQAINARRESLELHVDHLVDTEVVAEFLVDVDEAA